MNSGVLVRAALAVVAVAGSAIGVAVQNPPLGPPGMPMASVTSRPVSATVVATVLWTTTDSASSLNLMVLWRGANGWYLKGDTHGGGGSGSSRGQTARMQYGGLNFTVEFQRQPWVVRIQGKDIVLDPADANVVLVDQVDGPDMKMAGTLHVAPEMANARDVESLLKQSPKLVAFLQCDQKLPDARLQPLQATCQNLIGR